MRVLYYIIQWTWGIVENIIGGLLCLVFMCLGNKPERQRNGTCVETKYQWGGAFSIGMFMFLGKGCRGCISHEYGHSIQVLMMGPLWLFIVGIPSATRFWYRAWYYKYRYPKTHKGLLPYDNVWFEHSATVLGQKAFTNQWRWL